MLKRNVLYLVVILISILLVLDILLTRHNNGIIQENKEIQETTNQIKIYYDQIGKVVIHSLDLGLRGYAIVREQKLIQPYYNSLEWRDSLIHNVEEPLRDLSYDFVKFNVFRDSLDSYIEYCSYMKSLLDQNKDSEFKRIFKMDRGGRLWYEYILCEKDINDFLNRVHTESQNKFEAAIQQNQVLQIVLFLICFPTLLYTAIYTGRTFKLLELLRRTEAEKNRILTEQNATLEQFGFITAHNLRGPLARILGLGTLIRISTTQEERDVAIDKLLASTKDLDQVIKDLNVILDMRRNNNSMTKVNLHATAQRVVTSLEKFRFGATINIAIGKDLQVPTVSAYLESILYNLVSNAMKYRDPTRPLTIDIRASVMNGKILLRIADTGMGMDLKTVRNDLFGLYKRFHSHVEGRGIGLYLVKTQVDAMGGTLIVESEVGKGTAFLIYLRSEEDASDESEYQS